jgi:hypothetical protein
MEQSPSRETVNCAATQELLNILWEPKVCYRVHKSSPRVCAPIQMNSVLTSPSYSSKRKFNIILVSLVVSLRLYYPPKFIRIPRLLVRATCPTTLILDLAYSVSCEAPLRAAFPSLLSLFLSHQVKFQMDFIDRCVLQLEADTSWCKKRQCLQAVTF